MGWFAVLGATVLALVACGAPVEPPPPPAATPPPSTPPPSTQAPSPPRSLDAPVLAVKIDNAATARPAKGLEAADVVYVEPVEGGVSRLIAVFASQLPPVVGPVRSARETDLQLLPQFGHPALAFSGAAPALLSRIADSPIRDVSAARKPGAYFRDQGRPAPHNMFVRPHRLPLGDNWPSGAQPRFGPAPGGGVPHGHDVVRYRSASIAFDWSPEQHRWLISLDGTPAMSGDHQLQADTVVVQQVRTRRSAIRDVTGSPSPVAETVGQGTARVLRDGNSFPVTWSRPTPEQATTYTTPNGEPLPFAPGQTWTVLAPR